MPIETVALVLINLEEDIYFKLEVTDLINEFAIKKQEKSILTFYFIFVIHFLIVFPIKIEADNSHRRTCIFYTIQLVLDKF